MLNILEVADPSRGATTLALGEPGPSFEGLLGTDGLRYSFRDFVQAGVLVLIFSSNRCPTAKAYGLRMNNLATDYGPKGVQLIAINSNDPRLYPDESLARMVELADEAGYPFPYLVDEGQKVARAYGAECTFHVFVLDGGRVLRYQGRFDNARLEDRVTRHDLRDALEDVLAGVDVRTPTTRPFGCSLDFV
jgi:peroxiredoxin